VGGDDDEAKISCGGENHLPACADDVLRTATRTRSNRAASGREGIEATGPQRVYGVRAGVLHWHWRQRCCSRFNIILQVGCRKKRGCRSHVQTVAQRLDYPAAAPAAGRPRAAAPMADVPVRNSAPEPMAAKREVQARTTGARAAMQMPA